MTVYALIVMAGLSTTIAFRNEGHDFRFAHGSRDISWVAGVYRDTFFLADGVYTKVRGATWRTVGSQETKALNGSHIISRFDYDHNRFRIIIPMWLVSLCLVGISEGFKILMKRSGGDQAERGTSSG